MRYFISGKITENDNAENEFKRAEKWLQDHGNTVVNPYAIIGKLLDTVKPTRQEIMKICLSFMDLCDGIYMIGDWENSIGAKAELSYAKTMGKIVKFEAKQWAFQKTLQKKPLLEMEKEFAENGIKD